MVGASYDAAGNMTQDPAGASPRHTYSYDADGNLTAVDGGSTATYVYDSLNRRVQGINSAGTFEFVFDQQGRRVSSFVGGSGGNNFLEANFYTDTNALAFRNGGSVHFEHQNWLGTKRMVTDWTGANVEQITSLAFGDGRARTTGDDPDWYDFAGLDDDNEDATEHAQFRNYSPAQGRWFTPDPYLGSYDASNPQSFNRYVYALNNPVSFTDRSGLNCGQGTEDDPCIVNPPPPGCSYIVNPQGEVLGLSCSGMLSSSSGSTGGGQGSQNSGNSGNGGSGGGDGSNTSVFTCASEASGKVSIAGGIQALGIGTGGVGGFLANALGGNVFGGATDLIQSLGTGEGGGHSVFYNMAQAVFAGPTQGFGTALGNAIEGTPFASGPVDVATGGILGGINSAINAGGNILTLAGEASTAGLTAAEYASGVGEIKLGYDAITYVGGLVGCKLGIF